MISCKNLRKVFTDPKKGEILAVKEISFEARPGEVFGLLGVNGAGKTTAMRMLSTLIQPTSGEAQVAGFDIRTQSEQVRANIGFLSSTTTLYGRLTGFEILEYFGQLYGLFDAQLKDRIRYVTEHFNLNDFAGQLCDKMSTGQKQRISISRSILHDPKVMFFDEPCSGLDVVTAQAVMEFIEAAKAEGKTILFSTHIMSEAERLCDDIAFVHQGEIVSSGTLHQILEQHKEPTLERAFLSSIGYVSGVSN